MVLDGNVDPRGVWYDANLDQDIAFNTTFEIYFGWVAKYDSVYHLGDTRRRSQAYNSTLESSTSHPPTGRSARTSGTTSSSAAYYVFGWEDVGDRLRRVGQRRRHRTAARTR